MTCPEVRDELPALLYGELAAQPSAAVEEHLAQCGKCRAELAALRHARRLLDAVPAPTIQVDPAAIMLAENERQMRRLRRWRWAALASTAAAAVIVLLALGLNLEMRIEAHQMVLRWGVPPSPAPAEVAVVPKVSEPPLDPSPGLQYQLVLLTHLAEGLINRDVKQHEELAQLREGVRELQRNARLRINSVERDVSALYAVVFGTAKKGATE